MKKIASTTLKILIPLLISAVILFFTYRDYDFSRFRADLGSIKWGWLIAALSFSALGPLFRGLRWNLLLEPIGYDVPKKDTVLTVFTGYAANIIIPRVGEICRCGMLEQNARVPFSKGLGTLVAERVVDAVLLGLIVWICVKFRLGDKVKNFILGFWEGFMSLKQIRRLPLFLAYSIGIWLCYYFELYLAFYCLPSTAAVGPIGGLACFAASSVAVLVPTPNGAGPWNLAIVKMLGIYGAKLNEAQIMSFVLHFCQTMIYLLCGFIAWIALKIIHRNGTSGK